eukprot:422779-Pelagomonas_calceolata.AAC.6
MGGYAGSGDPSGNGTSDVVATFAGAPAGTFKLGHSRARPAVPVAAVAPHRMRHHQGYHPGTIASTVATTAGQKTGASTVAATVAQETVAATVAGAADIAPTAPDDPQVRQQLVATAGAAWRGGKGVAQQHGSVPAGIPAAAAGGLPIDRVAEGLGWTCSKKIMHQRRWYRESRSHKRSITAVLYNV